MKSPLITAIITLFSMLLVVNAVLAVTVDNTTEIVLNNKNVSITFSSEQEYSNILVTADSVTIDTYTLTPTATSNKRVNLTVDTWTDALVAIDVIGEDNTLNWVFSPVPYRVDGTAAVTYAGASVDADSEGAFSTAVNGTSREMRMATANEQTCISRNTAALTTLITYLGLLVAIVSLVGVIVLVQKYGTGELNIADVGKNWYTYVWVLVSVGMLVAVGLIVLSNICW